MPTLEQLIRFSEDGLDEIGGKLDNLKKRGETMFARLPKDLQRDLTKAGESLVDGAQKAITGTVSTATLAVARAGTTTFEGALQQANRYRQETTAISLSTGRSFEETGKKIGEASRRIGEMPAATRAWTRTVRSLTADWDNAVGSVDAYKDRALQLDKPMEAMAEQAGQLGRAFGIKSRQDVDAFFGTLDAGARRVGVSVQRMNEQWQSAAASMAALTTSKNLGPLAQITAAYAASSPSPDIAQGAQAYAQDQMRHGWRLTQKRMEKAGWLKKGETVYDEKSGEISPEMQVRMQAFLARDRRKWYGSRRRMLEVEGTDDLAMLPVIAAADNAADIYERTKGDPSKMTPEERKTLATYQQTAAGKRAQSEVDKGRRDTEAGMSMLPGEDAAVAVGGGAVGLAMTQASGLFSQAVDKFGGIVMNMAGGKYGSTSGIVAGVAGAGAGNALAQAGKAAGGAAAVVGAGYAGYELGSYIDEKTGLSDLIAEKLAKWMGSDYRSTPMDSAGDHGKLATEIANRTLKVQIVQDAPEPVQSLPGQPSR